MQLIQTITVGSGGASSIEFTSIPQDATDLLLLLSSRAGGTDPDEITFTLQLNSTSKDSSKILYGNGSSAITNSSTTLLTNRGGSTANTFANHSIYIPNYTSTIPKNVSADGVNESNTASFALQTITAMGFGTVTSPVTSVKVFPNGGFTWVQHTTASLYKITKA